MFYPPSKCPSYRRTYHENMVEPSKPLQQKSYLFGEQAPKSAINLNHQAYLHRKWKPVIEQKKLILQPKIVFVLEKKRMRIIESVRYSQISPCQYHPGIMNGSKLKTDRFWSKNNKKKQSIEGFDSQSVSQRSRPQTAHEDKKNPHMNFSLLYLTKRLKDREKQINRIYKKDRKTPKNQPNREKGSNDGFVDQLIGKTTLRKNSSFRPQSPIEVKQRPFTSISTNPSYRRNVVFSLD